MKKTIFLLSLIASLFYTSSLFADDGGKLFKVNLILFTHINRTSLNTEHWPRELLMPNLSRSMMLAPYIPNTEDTSQTPKPYQLLAPKDIGLAKIIKKLKNNGKHIILNIAWIQPAIQTNRWFHVFAGLAYDAQGKLTPNQTSDIHNMAPVANAKYQQFDGIVKISYNRTFTIATRLYLTMPSTLGSNIGSTSLHLAPLQSYAMISNHRAKKGQFVYFDHPLFGMIVRIAPIAAGNLFITS
jgi:hypothetical protein